MSEYLRACRACGSSDVVSLEGINGMGMMRCGACKVRYAVVPSGGGAAAAVDYNELYTEKGDYHAHVREAGARKSGHLIPLPRARRVALEEIKALRPGAVLEVGCGVGNYLHWLRESSVPCWGIDLSENAIRLARELLPGCPLEAGVLTPEVFGGKQFDVACAWEVIEHVDDPTGFLRSIYDRLAPGGHVFLSTPNYGSRHMWRDVPHDPRMRPPVHLTFWDRRGLMAQLSRAGFEEVTVRELSVPAMAARRSGTAVDRLVVYPEAVLWPTQRATLLGRARKPVA